MPKSISFKAAAGAIAMALGGTAMVAAVPVTAGHHKPMKKNQPNIVQAASSTGVHDTLVTAVKRAGLAGTLSGQGPFTVFAPTDTAFAKLPDGTIPTLLAPENRETLQSVLTYHVVAGEVMAADLVSLIRKHGGSATIETLSGATLTARLSGDTIIITDGVGRATAVTTADVDVSNGVIHVTDGVFLPG
ncbi:fasciclin domain-containing protein [Paraurantiacibacter namhicola]|uniref:Immunogenic protein MPT70 n=1 Tax=Paraurantiacibacter namhicola TaxID=645517 RepID=A0A1C7DB30_9SPHN|nr:fasciclin domain-containing protein [Paraurantiacibacter namhicola]ANU08655.1 Immunogenic protein MPT70 precursor [Paraurantiacibacter namhicola]